jgi:sulfite reductase (NADPH) hemoprotein beta-component
MYRYDAADRRLVKERAAQFRGQVARRVEGALTEEEFRPLRLMNGLYLQLHAYMLRVALPYGGVTSQQLLKLADIADAYDKGYGHFTTRQNLQYNWPRLSDVPDILDELASVDMHAIQTSGSCVRAVTADPFAGAAADEIADPRPTAEFLRQWSSLNPEFTFLPRKFKIAVTGSPADRAVIKFHDIGLRIVRNDDGELGYEVWVGGGLGRTPMIAKLLRPFLPLGDLLAYVEAIVRVYNAEGRRDNKYKARIKILVHEQGEEVIRRKVEEEFAAIEDNAPQSALQELRRIEGFFTEPELAPAPEPSAPFANGNAEFGRFLHNNVRAHKTPGYAIAVAPIKRAGGVPGDVSSEEMRALARLAQRFSLGELRVTAEQNIVFPYVRKTDLPALWRELDAAGLAQNGAGLIGDVVSCPGMDYCALATARSIPIAQELTERFADPALQDAIGPVRLKISGCVNSCGHHHTAEIGVLGLEKTGSEAYQVTLGGSASLDAAIGESAGRGFAAEEVVNAIERLLHFFLQNRAPDETLAQALQRLGHEPFKEALHANR